METGRARRGRDINASASAAFAPLPASSILDFHSCTTSGMDWMGWLGVWVCFSFVFCFVSFSFRPPSMSRIQCASLQVQHSLSSFLYSFPKPKYRAQTPSQKCILIISYHPQVHGESMYKNQIHPPALVNSRPCGHRRTSLLAGAIRGRFRRRGNKT